MAVAAVGAVTTKNDGGTVSSLTMSYTLDGAADLIIVRVHWRDGTQTVSSVTWNGAGMTSCGAMVVDADGQRAQMFYQVAPATGTHDVVVTFSGNVSFHIIGATGYSGVDQSTPISSFQSGTATSGVSPASITAVTSAAGDMVIAAMSADDGVNVVAQNQTADYEVIDSFVTLMGAGGRAAGAASVDPEWTYGANATWAMAALNIKAAAGVPSSLLLKMMHYYQMLALQ